MSQDCLFCGIVAGKIPSKAVAINKPILADEFFAFEDINPAAPHHVLIIPRRHLSAINEIEMTDCELIGKLVLAAKEIARDRGIDENGYRLVINTNPDGGQTVFHIHLHLLGGRPLTWPPG